MLLEEKFLEFHRYASSHNLPLEAISVGDENKVLCEMHYAANAPRNIYSHTKSFTVTAVGLAMEEGKLSLEDHVAEVFKDKLPSNPDPNLEKIQLKHLLVKRRIIRQHSHRIAVDFEAIPYGFHRDGFIAVGNHPVELCQRQLFAERGIHNVDSLE